MLLGDVHGNLAYMARTVLPYARRHEVRQIVQLGDFGFPWPGADPADMHHLDRLLHANHTDLLFLPGNHDYHPELARLAAVAPVNGDGHFQLTQHIYYTGRMSRWTWDETSFAAVGGATSTDREYRIKHNIGWWPQETLSDAEVDQAIQLGEAGPVDVLLTHDCPPSHPFDKLIPSFKSEDVHSALHRQSMGRIGAALRPRFWYHGHYHWPAHYLFAHRRGRCDVWALDRDNEPVRAATAIIDTDTWPPGRPVATVQLRQLRSARSAPRAQPPGTLDESADGDGHLAGRPLG
jgi:calcineurin-like phosphoesterase family protein